MSLADGVSMSACACMGPMFGESHCPCVMDRLGYPKNLELRAAEQARAEVQIQALFGPGGPFHNPEEEEPE